MFAQLADGSVQPCAWKALVVYKAVFPANPFLVLSIKAIGRVHAVKGHSF